MYTGNFVTFLMFQFIISLQIFFGFTFNTKSSSFKAKTRERKLFCCLSKSQQGAFVLFEAVIGYFLLIVAHLIYKKLQERSSTASSAERLV